MEWWDGVELKIRLTQFNCNSNCLLKLNLAIVIKHYLYQSK